MGIQQIGLGQLARGLGKVSHLARVHHHYRESCSTQGGHHSSLVAARRFEHYQLSVLEIPDQIPVTPLATSIPM